MAEVTPWPPEEPELVLAATAWMEDRSGGKAGMQAVMNVVCNRADNPRWWGRDIVSVCLKPMQFSAWNRGSSQIPKVKVAMADGDLQWATALDLATLAVAGELPDLTDNADSYYAASDPSPPAWAEAAHYCGTIGGQKFFRLYLGPRSPVG